MRRAFGLSVLFVVLAANSALADPQSEREKRKLHVPYVRAATDCLANAVANSSQFASAVETDNFRPLLSSAIDSCLPQLNAMVRMHDVIYGSGGMDFYRGPYLLDVDRAIRSRLAARIALTKAEIARTVEQRQALAARAAAERAEAEAKEKAARAEKVATAEKVRDVVRDRTMACIGRQALPMLVTDEKAEVVAKAAMLFCESEVNALVAATYDIISASGETANVDAIRIAAKQRVQDIVTAHVIRAKAELLLNADRQKNGKPAGSSAPTL